MDWVDNLKGCTVGLDTAPLIYFFEENPRYLPQVERFFASVEQGDFKVVTSTITLLEVLIYPLRNNNKSLALEYKDVLLNSKVMTLAITPEISEEAAMLRAKYELKTPDALQISAALKGGATHFLTNDIKLPELSAIKIISLDKLSNPPNSG